MATLIDLYNELYALTNALCGECTRPYSCCGDAGCGQAKQWARVIYKTVLQEHNRTETPYLTHYGCSVEAHIRPLCTTYLCPEARTKAPPRFMELRAEIALEEAKRWRPTTNPTP